MTTEDRKRLITEPELMELTELKPSREGIINVKDEEKKEGDKDEKTLDEDEKEAKVKEKNETILALIENILKKNVEEIIVDEDRQEELENAMLDGKAETVKKLLESGAPIDSWDWDERGGLITPLSFAANIDRLDIFCLVLLRAIREGKDEDEMYVNTAMKKACSKNSIPIVKILLKWGVGYEENYIGEELPERRMSTKVTKHKYQDTDATYIHFCAYFGSRDVLKLLLDKQSDNMDIDQKDNEGNTPLHLASKNGYTTCVSLLILKGAKIDEANNAKRTPLFVAIKNAPEELIYHLIRAGADVNVEDHRILTPIFMAAIKGRDTLIPILVNNGANVDARNRFYQTPLMLACKAGNAAAARELLLSGASLDAKDKGRGDAFTMARNKKQDDALSVIVRAHKGAENFKDLGWHKVFTKELYKSILTMLDCLIEPELYGVKVDFRVLEIDRSNITPGDGWEYEEGGRRRPYLLQRFASCDNEEIAYHGVTRLLVNQKFKSYGNFLLWCKTFIFISFLAAMLYALAQAAQEHRRPTTLYRNDVRPFTGWDILRFLCEIYVVLFWMSNLVTESAEVIQVLLYARKEISDKQQDEKSRLQEEQERNLRNREGEYSKKKETKTIRDKKEAEHGDVVPKPVDDDDGGKKSPGGTSIKSNVSDKPTKSTKLDKSEKYGGDSDASDKVDVDTTAKTGDGDKSDDNIGGKSDTSDKPDIEVAGGDGDSDASSMHLGSEKKDSDDDGSDDDGSDDNGSDDDDDSDEDSSSWGDSIWRGYPDDCDYDNPDDSDDDSDDDDDDYGFAEYLKERRKEDDEKAKKDEADAEEPPGVINETLEKVKDALQDNLIVRVFFDYFKDWYNWLDVTGLMLLFILIIFRIIIIIDPTVPYLEFQWVFATFAFAVNAFRLTKLLIVFKLFGTYMRIIILILLKDVPKFLLLLLFTFFFFSTTLYLSFRVPIIIGEVNINGTNETQVQYYVTLFDLATLQEEGLDKYYYVLIYPIRVLLEGNALEFNYVFDSLNIIAAVVYVVFLFLIIVVYLNVFIAQLSDTYADVKANAKKTVAKFRLEFIVQTQTTSLLALFFDFRKLFFDKNYMMKDKEWKDYFNAGISRVDDEDFTTQEPTESLYVVINKLRQQQKVNNRTQEILHNSIEKTVKTQQTDVEELKKNIVAEVKEMKTKLEALEAQNKEIIEKLTQIAQKV